jgi:hypothetical protein
MDGISFSSSVFMWTGRYASLTDPLPSSQYASVCFIQLVSSRLEKSSRACAPRDSFRASAAWMVHAACDSRFWSSIVSRRLVFQMSDRSVVPTSGKDWRAEGVG